METSSRMAKADALINTSSVTTYAWTVQSLSVSDLNTDFNNMYVLKHTSEKVLRVQAIGMLPEMVCVGLEGTTKVSDAGAITTQGPIWGMAPIMLMTGPSFEGEGNGLFMNWNQDIRSELTGPTVDADNKNERFSSSM